MAMITDQTRARLSRRFSEKVKSLQYTPLSLLSITLCQSPLQLHLDTHNPFQIRELDCY